MFLQYIATVYIFLDIFICIEFFFSFFFLEY